MPNVQIQLSDNQVVDLLSSLKYLHRTCTYCGDNMDGSLARCATGGLIDTLERIKAMNPIIIEYK